MKIFLKGFHESKIVFIHYAPVFLVPSSALLEHFFLSNFADGATHSLCLHQLSFPGDLFDKLMNEEVLFILIHLIFFLNSVKIISLPK